MRTVSDLREETMTNYTETPLAQDGPYMLDAKRDQGEAVVKLEAVIKQAKHQAKHNAPASPDMIRQLEDILALVSG